MTGKREIELCIQLARKFSELSDAVRLLKEKQFGVKSKEIVEILRRFVLMPTSVK